MITLWFMQAALKDLSSSPHRSPSFVICQRVLHKCHEIIFGDLPTPVIPYPSITVPFRSLFPRKKIKAHMEPAIVGIGMVLAGSPGMPRLTDIMGQVSVEQGRVEDSEIKSIESEDSDEDGISPIPSPPSPDDSEDQEEPSTLLARRRGPAQTVPALPLHLHGLRRSRHSQDPLGQLDAEQLTQRMQTESYQSSPSISSARATPFRTNHADALLANYDLASQVHLLKGHYCRSEAGRNFQSTNATNTLIGTIHTFPRKHLESIAGRSTACTRQCVTSRADFSQSQVTSRGIQSSLFISSQTNSNSGMHANVVRCIIRF